MKHLSIAFSIILLSIFACIKDDYVEDFVEPVLRIISTVDTIGIDESFQFEAMYLNNVGLEEEVSLQWFSSAPEVLSISTNDGLAQALQEGSAIISVKYNVGSLSLEAFMEVNVGAETVSNTTERMGTVASTSSYQLMGDFLLKEDGNGLILELSDNYAASTALPGLFVYLSNNKNSIGNAFEIASVVTFSGAHTYTIPNIGINDYSYLLYFCKPFNVKVGDGEIL